MSGKRGVGKLAAATLLQDSMQKIKPCGGEWNGDQNDDDFNINGDLTLQCGACPQPKP